LARSTGASPHITTTGIVAALLVGLLTMMVGGTLYYTLMMMFADNTNKKKQQEGVVVVGGGDTSNDEHNALRNAMVTTEAADLANHMDDAFDVSSFEPVPGASIRALSKKIQEEGILS
jgi:hypothetical protein